MNKRNLLTTVFIFTLFTIGYSQAWYPVGTGITGDYGILTEAVYNGDLYVGGWFYQAGGVTANNVARWSSAGWDSVGSGLTGGENNVNAMCVYNGKLYVGGAFFAAEGLSATNIASWDGSHWDTVGGGVIHCGSGAGWVDAMCVYNGKLYVAGAFCTAGHIKANNIACWDGTKWDSLSSGINDSVYTLAVYNGKLYAGGQFTRAGNQTVQFIASWNGTTWSTVGSSGANSSVLCMQVYNGDLYVGGTFSSIGGASVFSIATWNGTLWASPGIGIGGNVNALCVYDGKLYAGGLFAGAGSLVTTNITSWNGTIWDTVSTAGIDNTVSALAVYDSAVYAGGAFTVAGKVNASDIAAWGGISLGLNELSNPANNVTLYPNPNNGQFDIVLKSQTTGINTIEVYNILGEQIYNKALSPDQYTVTINIGSQPNGVYLYRLLNASGVPVSQGKIVVR